MEFTPQELQAMHRYCLKYRELVLSDSTPSKEQDANFLIFQRHCYESGVAHGA
jgi:hypothetical protein